MLIAECWNRTSFCRVMSPMRYLTSHPRYKRRIRDLNPRAIHHRRRFSRALQSATLPILRICDGLVYWKDLREPPNRIRCCTPPNSDIHVHVVGCYVQPQSTTRLISGSSSFPEYHICSLPYHILREPSQALSEYLGSSDI